jgi:hypothetical protein
VFEEMKKRIEKLEGGGGEIEINDIKWLVQSARC